MGFYGINMFPVGKIYNRTSNWGITYPVKIILSRKNVVLKLRVSLTRGVKQSSLRMDRNKPIFA